MPQFARPSSDISIGGWLDQAGGALALYQAIDEAVVNDDDYIQSGINPDYDTYTGGLNPVLDPNIHTGHVFRYRYRKPEGVTDHIDLTVRLMQGDTVIATWVHTSISESWVTAEQTLSEAEAGAITSYSTLRHQYVADVSYAR